MFDAKNHALQCLENINKDPITTAELANELGLSRSVVSHYLNELVKDNKVLKLNGRPVKWQKKTDNLSQLENCFADFIGYQGSMREIITQVSAAVAYPPNGLNILITGHSGVCKSYLAGKIAAYARQKNVIEADAPYIVLNCADYANNPKLVSSMLFVYVKGAYTGADESKEGLLKEANGGYLFLDEVHRLSSENREKLFSFIDSGEFYRMGDNVNSVRSNVRLIMATTEKPEIALLETFLRRILVRVTLPDFIQRPIDERFALLNYLFYQEAKKISKKIDVNQYVVSALLQLNKAVNL